MKFLSGMLSDLRLINHKLCVPATHSAVCGRPATVASVSHAEVASLLVSGWMEAF